MGGLSELGLIDALEHVLFPEIQWAVSKVIVELTVGFRIRRPTNKCQRDESLIPVSPPHYAVLKYKSS